MRRPRSHHIALPIAFASLSALTGCPGSLDEPARFDGIAEEVEVVTLPIEGCGSIETDLVQKRCTTSGCHSGRGLSGALDLRSSNLYARLANQAATTGGTLIVPGDPNASVLYQKLRESPPFGERMPVGTPLDEASVECVRKWIEVNR